VDMLEYSKTVITLFKFPKIRNPLKVIPNPLKILEFLKDSNSAKVFNYYESVKYQQ